MFGRLATISYASTSGFGADALPGRLLLTHQVLAPGAGDCSGGARQHEGRRPPSSPRSSLIAEIGGLRPSSAAAPPRSSTSAGSPDLSHTHVGERAAPRRRRGRRRQREELAEGEERAEAAERTEGTELSR